MYSSRAYSYPMEHKAGHVANSRRETSCSSCKLLPRVARHWTQPRFSISFLYRCSDTLLLCCLLSRCCLNSISSLAPALHMEQQNWPLGVTHMARSRGILWRERGLKYGPGEKTEKPGLPVRNQSLRQLSDMLKSNEWLKSRQRFASITDQSQALLPHNCSADFQIYRGAAHRAALAIL